jgi:hypothetical protein
MEHESYNVTIRCGCSVYVSCHPGTGVAHTRIIEWRAQTCGNRTHAVGARLGVWELLPDQAPTVDPSDAFADALQRAQAEYLEMPGLQLTAAQAARLWCFDSALCSRVLSALVETRFLVRTRNAAFTRA